MKSQVLKINPVAKPRMTRRDVWLDPPRPCVAKYWKFKDELLWASKKIDICWEPLSLTFCIPMSKSWSKKKQMANHMEKHTSTPDLDNLIKAFKDCLLTDDSTIWHYGEMKKIWAYEGMIIVHG